MSEWETITPQRRAGDGWETIGAPAKPSKTQSFLDDTKRGLMFGGPMGAAVYPIMKRGNEAIAQLAYEGGGKVTDIASNLGASPEVAAGAGYATNVGIQAIPSLVSMPLGRMGTAPFEKGARSLMTSAIKPTLKDLKSGDAARAVDTLLKEGINPTAGGVTKLRASIGQLNDDIAKAIEGSSASIDKEAAGQHLMGTYKKFLNQVNASSDLNAIRGAWDDFINHPLLAGSDKMPVELAQKMKQGTYKVLAKKYGQIGTAETEAQKAIARGLKDEIAQAIPQVSALNARESELINALNVAERRALMEANKNPMGLSLLANHPATWAAFLADRSALVKSLLARGMESGKQAIPQGILGTGVAGATGYEQLRQRNQR